MDFRVGNGYDVHRLAEGIDLWICGIKIEHSKGCVAHSDGDTPIHALCDAMLGALALGDIGKHFPNSDPRWKDVASHVFLMEVRRMLGAKGATLVNVDATVIAEAPRLLPHVEAMRTHIAAALGVARERVNLKATTNEGMGFVGRAEGIAAMAVASVDFP